MPGRHLGAPTSVVDAPFQPVAALLTTLLILAAISLIPRSQSIWFLVPGGASLLLSLVTRVSPGAVARTLRRMLPFLLLFVVSLLLQGDRSRAIDLLIRGLLSAWQGSWLITAFSFPRLVEALQRLGIPPLLVTLILEIWRFLFLAGTEASRMRLAALNRGWSARYVGQVGIRRAGGIAAGLLGRSLIRADRVELAMKHRGFVGRLPVRPAASWAWLDYLILALGSLVICLAGWRGLA